MITNLSYLQLLQCIIDSKLHAAWQLPHCSKHKTWASCQVNMNVVFFLKRAGPWLLSSWLGSRPRRSPRCFHLHLAELARSDPTGPGPAICRATPPVLHGTDPPRHGPGWRSQTAGQLHPAPKLPRSFWIRNLDTGQFSFWTQISYMLDWNDLHLVVTTDLYQSVSNSV